jgi:hypothetical protein
MKIIIKESKIDMLMSEYLNSWIEPKAVSRHSDFIIIQGKCNEHEDEWDDFMEYDYSDGRLWLNRDFRKLLIDLFGKNQVETMTFVGKWFEDKFGVEVKFVE